MFEALLEKILLAKLGKFIDGLDRENLKIGVWSGDIVLENVKINARALLMLQMPLILKYSFITRLVVKVPWTKLTSSSVEIHLQGLYLIIMQQPEEDWHYSEEGEILKRKEMIESHEQRWKQLQEQAALSPEDEMKQKGFLEKLTAKILDNLKIVIEDIHIRFEHTMKGRTFSCGLTLKKIDCFTTNNEWNSEFTDRHQSEIDDHNIFKLLEVVNLGLYWKSGDSMMLNSLQSETEILFSMQKQINSSEVQDYLIAPINVTAKIVHDNDLTQLDHPRYLIHLSLPEIIIKYNQKQFHDTVKLIDYYAGFNKFIVKAESTKKFKALSPNSKKPKILWKFAIDCILRTIKQRKNRTVDQFAIPKATKEFYESQYKLMHRKLKKKGSISKKEEDLYNKIIYIVKSEELCEWTDQVLEVIQKEEANRSSSKSSGWFSYLWGGTSVIPDIEGDETYETIFKERSSMDDKSSAIPKSFVWINFEFFLGKGSFELCKPYKGENGKLESLEFKYEQLILQGGLRNPGGDFIFQVKELTLTSLTPVDSQIVCQKFQDRQMPILEINLSLSPLDSDAAALFKLESQPLEVNFSSQAIAQVDSFFIVPKAEDTTKTAAWDTLQGLQDSTQETIIDLLHGDTKYIINIKACGPRINLPSPTGQGVFLVSLGDLEINSQSSFAEDIYENFDLKVSSIEFRYITNESISIPIIPPFGINNVVNFMKSSYRTKKWELKDRKLHEKPDIIVSGELPKLSIMLTPSIYNQLTRIQEIFQSNDAVSSRLTLDKKTIMKRANLIARLKKQGIGIQSWYSYFAVLSGGYIYFFNSEKESAASTYFYIKDCSLIDISEKIKVPNTLKLYNRYGECVLSFEKKQDFNKWQAGLNDQISEFQSLSSAAAPSKPIFKKANKAWLEVNFGIPDIYFKLYSDDIVEMSELYLSSINVKCLMKVYDIYADMFLKSMYIKDMQRESWSDHFNYLAKSIDEGDRLIDMNMHFVSIDSNAYKDQDLILGIKFGFLQVNWNPDFFYKTIGFFTGNKSSPEQQNMQPQTQQEFEQLQPNHVLLNLNIQVGEIDLYLNNVKKELCLAVASVRSLNSDILLKNGGMDIKGSLDIRISPSPWNSNNFIAASIAVILENTRHLNDEKIWEDIYTIQLKLLNISSFSQKIAEDLKMNLDIRMPILTNDQLDNIDINKAYTINGNSEKIKLIFCQNDFCTLLKLTNIDLSYDDPNAQRLSQLPRVSTLSDRGGVFFIIKVKILMLSILLNHNGQDIAEIFCIDQVVDILKYNDGSMDLTFVSYQTLGLLSEDKVSEEYSENQISKKIFGIPGYCKDLVEENSNLRHILFAPLAESIDDSTPIKIPTLKVDLKINIDSSKDIIIELLQLRINVHYAVILQIQNFFMFGLPDYEKETEAALEYMNKERPVAERISKNTLFHFPAPKMLVNICIRQPIMILPSFVSPRVLVCQSNFNVVYLKEKEADFVPGERPVCTIKFVAHELEIYTCNFQELMSKTSFQNIQKRRILEPFQVIYESLAQREDNTVTNNITDFIIEKITLIVSHQDINLINYITKFQNDMLGRDKDIIEALAKIENKVEEPKKEMMRRSDTLDMENEVGNSQSESSSTTTYSLSGVYVMIVNDAFGAYTPVIDLNIYEFTVKMAQNSSNWNAATSLTLRSNYYNPLIDTWEPLIELFTTTFEMVSWPNGNPKTQIIIMVDRQMPLNINITEIMIKHTYQIIDSWNKSSQSSHIIDNKEVVSPLCIVNYTGCRMEVWKTKRSGKKPAKSIEVQPGQTVDYEVDTTEMRNIDMSQEFLTLCLFKFDMPFPPINNIPINKVQSLAVEIAGYGEEFPIILEIELLDTRKILKVRSSILIINETNYDFKIKFSRYLESEEMMCESRGKCSVPVDYVKHLIGFMPTHINSEDWTMIHLQEFTFQKSGHSTEIKIGDFYIALHMVKDPQNLHKKTIYIKPPILYRNQMPYEIKMKLLYGPSAEMHEIAIFQGKFYEEHKTSRKSNVTAQVSMRNFNFCPKILLISEKDARPPKYLKMYDKERRSVNISINYKTEGSHIITFYPIVTIINNTSIPISFYFKKKGTSRVVPGQSLVDCVIPCEKTKKIAIGMGHHRSNLFKITAVGAKNIVEFDAECNDEEIMMKYQFVYSVYLAQIIKNEYIFTKIVTVSPRFLLENTLNEDLLIRQFKSSSQEMILARQSKEPFHWPDSRAEHFLNIKIGGGHWGWTGPFTISSIGNFIVQCKDLGGLSDFKIINVEVQLQDCTAYVVFREETIEAYSYKIENNTSAFSVAVYQKDNPAETRWIGNKEYCLFGWTRPMDEHEVVVEIYYGSLNELIVHSGYSCKYNLDKIGLHNSIKIKKTEELGHFVFGAIVSEGGTKILKLEDTPKVKVKNAHEIIYSQTNISIPSFGISLIEHNNDKAAEIMYISVQGISILTQMTKRQLKADMLIEKFQIDNQYNSNAVFPVLLCPSLPELSVFHTKIILYFDPNCMHFEFCEFSLQSLTLNLESSIFKIIMEFIGRAILQESVVDDAQVIFAKHASPTWTAQEQVAQNKRFYFEKLKLCPIKIIITFVPLKETKEKSDPFNTLAKAFGMAIIAIDSAPVKLRAVEMDDCFGTQAQIVSALMMNYKSQIVSQLLSLIGHAEILGNPIGLLNNLGTGFVDFFYEPAQGLINSPMSFGKGLLKGAGSLVTNTVQGTFGTVSKLANGIATGLTSITQSKEYILERQREKAKNRPQNIIDGIGLGFKTLFKNASYAITGIVIDPIVAYKKSKAKGILRGGFRGISGIIVKPVAGILDATSNAAEGIKNTAAPFSSASKLQRVRAPRPFYGHTFMIKPYNEYDSQVVHLMNQLKKGIFINEKFVYQVASRDIRGQDMLFVIYIMTLVLIDIRNRKILWIVDINTVQHLQKIDEGLVLHTSPSQRKKTKGKDSFLIPFPDKDLIRKLDMKLRDILEHFK
ncbi:VPS13_3 [Blepharisma stoltei]|uniref:PH domain-containing protein n=1 Tax=Blepharisma stoltei TaxID=1481888 RepID=A0AAU9KI48_9CILI|nr:unnamed protein product [Blepharisma stoltei]